ALALASLEESPLPFDPAVRQDIGARRQRTEAWIRSAKPLPPEKSESLAGWVVYEHQRGDPARAKQMLDELLSRQHEDGGWGMKRDDPSHLLVTGAALLALKSVGLPNDNPAVAKVQRLLLARQAEDGRWREKGRH